MTEALTHDLYVLRVGGEAVLVFDEDPADGRSPRAMAVSCVRWAQEHVDPPMVAGSFTAVKQRLAGLPSTLKEWSAWLVPSDGDKGSITALREPVSLEVEKVAEGVALGDVESRLRELAAERTCAAWATARARGVFTSSGAGRTERSPADERPCRSCYQLVSVDLLDTGGECVDCR